MKKGVIFAIAAVSLIVVFAAASTYFKGKQARSLTSTAQSNASVFNREYAPSLGAPGAKVVITEFLDPGCETCAAFDPFLKNALGAFPGKIRLVIRYRPLHHGADDMVRILEAARFQGKYWEVLKLMYETQPEWASHSNPQPQRIWRHLPKTGLDIEKLKNDMNRPEIARIIQQDTADAEALNVHKTPGFFVNDKPLIRFGAKQLRELILSELRAHYPREFATPGGRG